MGRAGITHNAATTALIPRSSRWSSLLLVLLMLAAACGGGGDPADAKSPSDGSSQTVTDNAPTDTGTEEAAQGDGETESTQEAPAPTEEISAQVAAVNLPTGMQLFAADHQTASVGGISYFVSPRAEGVRLVAVDADRAFDTDALIAGGRFAEVFNSGTRVVMTGSDEAGNLVVLSSTDGVTFTEVLIPVPQRYIDADVWQATSLLADVSDVADLNGELYLIARLGVAWPSDLALVARHAYTISEETGDAARFAGIIRQTPQPDGDIQYTFEVDDEVVFEALGSEAGVEPGYRQAYQDSLDADTSFHGGWIISGATAEQTSPPLDGELDADMRLRDLYPVRDGVAALVTDFSPDDPDPEEDASGGEVVLVSTRTTQTKQVRTLHHTWDGQSWEPVGQPIGDPIAPEPEVVADVENDTWAMLFRQGANLTFLNSKDGLDWSVPEWAIDVSLPDGSTVQVASGGGRTALAVLGAEPDDTAKVWLLVPTDDGIELREIEVDPGRPKAWQGDDADLPVGIVPTDAFGNPIDMNSFPEALSWWFSVTSEGFETARFTNLFFGETGN